MSMSAYDEAQLASISPIQFVQMIEALKPPTAAGHLLLGQQHESSGISPTGFTGPVSVDHFTHLNTGAFTMNPQTGWTERTVDCDGTLMLVLDDVGEKTDVVPSVEPTFKIRTKPGSEQWGYVYNEPVSLEMGAGMATAAAAAGISDGFIERRPHHWWRMPESLPPPKVKERYAVAEQTGAPVDLTPAKLVYWSGQTWGYHELARALGLQPQPENVDGYEGSVRYDAETGEQDPILTWLDEKGWVRKKRPDASGWRDVICPNWEQHSDQKRPWGRYVPPNAESRAAFMCHHSHCLELGITEFRETVETWGGPSVATSKGHAQKVQPSPLGTFEERIALMPPVLEQYVPPAVEVVLPALPMSEGDVAREMLQALVGVDPIALDEGLSRISEITGVSTAVLKRQYRELTGAAVPAPTRTEIVGDFIIVNGSVVPNAHNAELLLSRAEYEGVFALDTFRGRPMVMKPIPYDERPIYRADYPRPLEDVDYLTIRGQMSRHVGWHRIAKGDVIDAVDKVCARTLYHPIRDYFEQIKTFTGRNLLDNWMFDMLRIPRGENEEYIRQVGRKWLIGAVARVMVPGCQMDSALILEGPQGVGKSTALRILAGDDFFGDALPSFHDKAASEYLQGKWIIEMAELTSVLKSELEDMRSFLTRRVESYRPAYGRQLVEYKRQCIFAGSTNRDDFLRDPDGERRMWIVKIENTINLQLLEQCRDGLWAEAFEAYEKGEKWYLTEDAAATAKIIQKSKVGEDVWENILAESLGELKNTCIRQCREFLSNKGEVCNNRAAEMRIAECLKRLGFKKTVRKTFPRYGGQVMMWEKHT